MCLQTEACYDRTHHFFCSWGKKKKNAFPLLFKALIQTIFKELKEHSHFPPLIPGQILNYKRPLNGSCWHGESHIKRALTVTKHKNKLRQARPSHDSNISSSVLFLYRSDCSEASTPGKAIQIYSRPVVFCSAPSQSLNHPMNEFNPSHAKAPPPRRLAERLPQLNADYNPSELCVYPANKRVRGLTSRRLDLPWDLLWERDSERATDRSVTPRFMRRGWGGVGRACCRCFGWLCYTWRELGAAAATL